MSSKELMSNTYKQESIWRKVSQSLQKVYLICGVSLVMKWNKTDCVL